MKKRIEQLSSKTCEMWFEVSNCHKTTVMLENELVGACAFDNERLAKEISILSQRSMILVCADVQIEQFITYLNNEKYLDVKVKVLDYKEIQTVK